MKPAAANTRPVARVVAATMSELERRAKKSIREQLGPRYGIYPHQALGVAMGDLLKIAKRLGRHHELAAALWATGWYEARLLAALVDEPERVTAAQMDAWCADFDNWAIVDTVCFKLFDQSPHAWKKVKPWAARKEEFRRRAGYVLLACLAGHDARASDAAFLQFFPLLERGAADRRNFVMKAVNWALRMIGERSAALHAAANDLARRLADSPHASARWIGKDARKQLASPAVRKRLSRRARATVAQMF